MRKKHHAFTLMELLIVMAIVGILAAIAIPAYTQYVIRSARTQAKAYLLDMAQMEERFFTNNATYIVVPVLGGGTPPNGWNNWVGDTSANARYGITVSPLSSNSGTVSDDITTTYIAWAVPLPTFNDATCGALGVDSLGRKYSVPGYVSSTPPGLPTAGQTATTTGTCW